MKQINNLRQLKQDATNTNLECCILLNGGARSRKTLTYFPETDTWDIMHSISGGWEDDVSTDHLENFTNILTALKKGALWAY